MHIEGSESKGFESAVCSGASSLRLGLGTLRTSLLLLREVGSELNPSRKEAVCCGRMRLDCISRNGLETPTRYLLVTLVSLLSL